MDDSESGALMAVLWRLQEEAYLSTRGLAQQLGFSPSHLSMLYAGKRKPGLRFLQAVMRRYPEMPRLLREEIQERQTRGDQRPEGTSAASPPMRHAVDDDEPGAPDSR